MQDFSIRACVPKDRLVAHVVSSIESIGFAVVENVLGQDLLAACRRAMYEAQTKIIEEVGEDRLQRANELGVLRLMFKYDDFFMRLLEIPELLAVVDSTLGSTAILHLQNGFILPPFTDSSSTNKIAQLNFHMDFPRVLNGYLASINIMFAVDEFTPQNGATLVIPGTHQKMVKPNLDVLRNFAMPVCCPAGSMLVFDSTLWHAAGRNHSTIDRLAINHQFTRSYIKQQIDYVRALGEDVVVRQPARTQQLLGYYTRVVTSLDEYYRPENERLYRGGQG